MHQGAHHGDGVVDHADAARGQGQPGDAGVAGVRAALDQAVALEAAGQLGDVDGIEAGEIGQLTLAGPGAAGGYVGGGYVGGGYVAEGGQHDVLGVGQPEGSDRRVDGGPPLGGQEPHQVADR